jgi:hypothetical protein
LFTFHRAFSRTFVSIAEVNIQFIHMHSCLGSILNVFHNKMHCHTAIENVSDPIGYLLDFTNPYYTALAGNMKARAKKDTSF